MLWLIYPDNEITCKAEPASMPGYPENKHQIMDSKGNHSEEKA